MSTFRTAIPLVLVPVVVWLTSIAGAEIAFRWLGAAPPSELAGLYEQMPSGSYRHRAMVDADANWFGARFSVHTDGIGFRCDAERRFAVRQTDRIDMLIVGDSQAYGQGVEFSDSLAGTLIAQAAADGVRAANAAIGGHYLRNQLELLQLLARESDIRARHFVVLLTPYLLASPGAISRVTVGRDGRLYGGEVTRWKETLVRIKTHTVLYAKLRDALRSTILPPTTDDAVTRMFLNEYETGPAEARRTDEFLAFMTSFKEWAAVVDADVQLVYTPLTLEFDFDALTTAAKGDGVQIDAGSPYRVARAVATQLSLPLHDLRPTLDAFHEKGQALSLTGDPHYNRAVSMAAGGKIWEALRPSVKPSPEMVSLTTES